MLSDSSEDILNRPLRLELLASTSSSSASLHDPTLVTSPTLATSPSKPLLHLHAAHKSRLRKHLPTIVLSTLMFVCAFAVCLCLAMLVHTHRPKGKFYAAQDQYWLSRVGEPAQPFRLLSGEFHYFRTVPEYWEDRLQRIKSMGLNAVQIYIPWNWHCPLPNQCEWKGGRDVVKFIKLARRLGLLVLVRPEEFQDKPEFNRDPGNPEFLGIKREEK